MTVNQLEKYFDGKLSRAMSCEWDNDGLMLCQNSEKEVKKALLTLDVTEQAIKKAIDIGADAIFTHHPFIFKPLKTLCDTSKRSKLIFELVRHDIAVFSYHTRLDAAEGGVNDILSELLMLKNIKPMGEGELALGRIGDISPCTLDEIAYRLKNVLAAQSICVAESDRYDGRIERVSVLGGACDSEYVYAAIEGEADLLVCGDASYNLVLDANLDGISVICAGHYASENPVLSYFECQLKGLGVQTERFDCGYFRYI